jgi:predicted RNA-binding protein with PUA-like domain
MRDKMRLNDRILFYHSNCKVPGVAGVAKVPRSYLFCYIIIILLDLYY